MEPIIFTRYRSPAGKLIVGSFGDKLCICDWDVEPRRAAVDRLICRYLRAEYRPGMSEIIAKTLSQLEEYFNQERTHFTIPLMLTGSPFQLSVRAELMKIPYGTTMSYASLARHINLPRAVRAVAAAIASNPISILVPCHRVVGSDGSLTGYAGGLSAKQQLLDLEASTLLKTSSKMMNKKCYICPTEIHGDDSY